MARAEPVDERLTCDQIMAEMQATGGPMMSQETVAQNKASADATLALMQKQNAEMKGFVAGQVAVGIGAAAVGMLPGGGFATQAIMAAQQAQAKNFADKQAKIGESAWHYFFTHEPPYDEGDAKAAEQKA